MICMIVGFVIIMFLAQAYYYIAIKEHVIVFPIYSIIYPDSNHGRNCRGRNGCMMHNLTRLDNKNVFRKLKEITEESYYPFKLGGGLTHTKRLGGTTNMI